MTPNTSFNNVSAIQSFNKRGNAQYVRHTYFDNISLVAGEKEYTLFTQAISKGAISNWGVDKGKLPNNISFIVKQFAFKMNLNGKDQAVLREIQEELMANSIVTVEIGEQNYGEFTLAEFLPSVIASFDSGAPNILQNIGDFNTQPVIDFPDGFMIPVEENATIDVKIRFNTAPSAEAAGVKLMGHMKGFKLSKTV